MPEGKTNAEWLFGILYNNGSVQSLVFTRLTMEALFRLPIHSFLTALPGGGSKTSFGRTPVAHAPSA